MMRRSVVPIILVVVVILMWALIQVQAQPGDSDGDFIAIVVGGVTYECEAEYMSSPILAIMMCVFSETVDPTEPYFVQTATAQAEATLPQNYQTELPFLSTPEYYDPYGEIFETNPFAGFGG